MTFHWTDARIDALKTLYADVGLTMRQISVELGCSKNAVIGKVHRLGLNVADCLREKARKEALRKQREADAERRRQRRALRELAQAARKTAEKPPGKPKPAPGPFTYTGPGYSFLETLERDGCRFYVSPVEVEPTLFCGEPKADGEPYCEGHCAIAYTPARPSRRNFVMFRKGA